MPTSNTLWFPVALLVVWVGLVTGFPVDGAIDTRFVETIDGDIADADSGLVWRMGPDQGTTWEGAMQWIASQNAHHRNWRMPTALEVRSLYHVGDGVTHLAPVFGNSGYWAWAVGDDGAPTRWLYSFSYGGEGWNGPPPSSGGRVFAVRVPAR
jgi:hypothetical protein